MVFIHIQATYYSVSSLLECLQTKNEFDYFCYPHLSIYDRDDPLPLKQFFFLHSKTLFMLPCPRQK